MIEAATEIRPRWPPPQAARLTDGRLHLQDGPIDLVIEAWGARAAVETAYRAAARRFDGMLAGLCAELPELRRQVSTEACRLQTPIARRMRAAVAPYASEIFITPMAAVAGAVAEAVLAAMASAAMLDRAYVNNGGDIALHLAPGQSFEIGLVDRPDRPSLFAHARIAAEQPVRGIATSGWRGRSFSLGVADAVTVLAARAADADAAATIIANAVDLGDHPGIRRVPASQLLPESDLRDLLVTRDVPSFNRGEKARALDLGSSVAESLVSHGRIHAAALHLQGETRIVGTQSALLEDHVHA